MSVRINDTAPDFTADTTEGPISFHDWIGDSYAILFSHPRDFTPVCTTEFSAVARLVPEFEKRNTKVLGVSVDSTDDHRKWKADIAQLAGVPANFAIVDDTSLKVAKAYDMFPADASLPDERTPAHSATVRTVFIIGPDKKIRAMLLYPMSSGRNFDEVLRLLDSIQLTERKGVATPVNWRPGDSVIIPPSVSDEEAKAKYPGGWETVKPYLRRIPQPQD